MTPTEQLAIATRVARALAKSHYQDVEDLAQDGVIAILQAPAFSGHGDETRYLEWRAYCGMVDRLRQRTPWNRLAHVKTATFVDVAGILEPSGPPTHDLEFEASERAACIRRAIADLPPRQAEAVRRYYLEDEEQAEIARAFGVTQGRVSQLLARARGRLRVTLNEEI
jgi:RNA polymerase sigma factor (sigma-70 family)